MNKFKNQQYSSRTNIDTNCNVENASLAVTGRRTSTMDHVIYQSNHTSNRQARNVNTNRYEHEYEYEKEYENEYEYEYELEYEHEYEHKQEYEHEYELEYELEYEYEYELEYEHEYEHESKSAIFPPSNLRPHSTIFTPNLSPHSPIFTPSSKMNPNSAIDSEIAPCLEDSSAFKELSNDGGVMEGRHNCQCDKAIENQSKY